MRSGFCVYELNVYTKSITASLRRTFQHIADIKLATNLLHIKGVALECEGRIAGDHERSGNSRKVRSQALGHAINEVLLLRIAADINEWQHHYRQMRC